MDFTWDENQTLLKQTAQSFMAREVPRRVIAELQESETGTTPALWQTISKLGWLGLVIPPEHGGAGGTMTDAAALFEELGKGPLPGPLFSSGIVGALILTEAASDAIARQLLPRVAEGDDVASLAIAEPDYAWGAEGVRMRPSRRGDSYVLSGTKLFVSYGAASTQFVVAVRTGDRPTDITLLAVDAGLPGVSVRNLPGFLSWEAAVTFDGVEVPAANVLGGENGGWAVVQRALTKAVPVLCSYMVGSCQAVYDMSVAYANSRVQFGVPIGKLTRVQDHVIRLVNHLDCARWTTYEALWKVDTGQPDAEAAAHMAKAVTSEAYWEVCNAAHEVTAGIGSDRNFGLIPHTQMSRTMFNYLGDPKWHKRRMADALAW